MPASKNEYIKEASSTIQKMTAEKEMQLRMQAREDYLYWERIRNNRIAKQEKELLRKDASLQEKEAVIQAQAEELAALRKENEKLAQLRKENEELAKLRAELEALKGQGR